MQVGPRGVRCEEQRGRRGHERVQPARPTHLASEAAREALAQRGERRGGDERKLTSQRLRPQGWAVEQAHLVGLGRALYPRHERARPPHPRAACGRVRRARLARRAVRGDRVVVVVHAVREQQQQVRARQYRGSAPRVARGRRRAPGGGAEEDGEGLRVVQQQRSDGAAVREAVAPERQRARHASAVC
eukprot:scaffold77829_cov68-Phaeocystis_antarctica.AAC.7